MKLIFLLSLFVFSLSGFAQTQVPVINLSSGQSVLVGGYQVACQGAVQPQPQRMYKCSAGMNGPSFSSDWQYDQEDARQQAMERCERGRGAGCGATSCRPQ